jgi:hypothetical protein
MTVGFQSYTSDGKLQFDASSSAFTLIDSGSVSCVDLFAIFSGFYIGALYGSSGNPVLISAPGVELVGLRCTSAYCFPEIGNDGFYISTQPCTFTDADWPTSERTNLSSHTVEWWAYKSMRGLSPPASGVGLQLLNADSTLCWDNSLNPLKVENSFRWSSTTHGGTTQSLNAAGRIALFAGGKAFRARTPLTSSARTGWVPGIKMIGNNISIKDVAVSGYGPPASGFANDRIILSGVI